MFEQEGWRGKVRHEKNVDVRYCGQGYELSIPLSKNLLKDFEREHQRRYGYIHPYREVELVTLRLRAVVKSPRLKVITVPVENTDPQGTTGAKTGHVGTAALGRPGRATLGSFSAPEVPVLF